MSKSSLDPAESELLRPVLRLFPKRRYGRFLEAELGRKRIDLLCIPRPSVDSSERVAVELKVRDWRRALWQAYLDLQVAHRAYIAIWHAYAHVPLRNQELLEQYGVGLIIVRPKSAEFVISSRDRVLRISRDKKLAFYDSLADSV